MEQKQKQDQSLVEQLEGLELNIAGWSGVLRALELNPKKNAKDIVHAKAKWVELMKEADQLRQMLAWQSEDEKVVKVYEDQMC